MIIFPLLPFPLPIALTQSKFIWWGHWRIQKVRFGHCGGGGHTLQKVSPTSKTRRILLSCAPLSVLKQSCLHKSCSDFFIFQEMCKFPPISDTAGRAFAPNAMKIINFVKFHSAPPPPPIPDYVNYVNVIRQWNDLPPQSKFLRLGPAVSPHRKAAHGVLEDLCLDNTYTFSLWWAACKQT